MFIPGLSLGLLAFCGLLGLPTKDGQELAKMFIKDQFLSNYLCLLSWMSIERFLMSTFELIHTTMDHQTFL